MNAPLKLFLLIAALLLPAAANAQGYSIDWHKFTGGGGASSGGQFSVSGSVGQAGAAGGTMTGGPYSLTGGFWGAFSIAPVFMTFTLTSETLAGQDFSLSLPSQFGVTYLLEFKNSLIDPAWTPGPSLLGTGGPITLADTNATGSTRFYRVRIDQ